MWKDCLLSVFCWQCHLCRLHRDFMSMRGGSSGPEATTVAIDDEDDGGE